MVHLIYYLVEFWMLLKYIELTLYLTRLQFEGGICYHSSIS
jgi:hypothetical protein